MLVREYTCISLWTIISNLHKVNVCRPDFCFCNWPALSRSAGLVFHIVSSGANRNKTWTNAFWTAVQSYSKIEQYRANGGRSIWISFMICIHKIDKFCGNIFLTFFFFLTQHSEKSCKSKQTLSTQNTLIYYRLTWYIYESTDVVCGLHP